MSVTDPDLEPQDIDIPEDQPELLDVTGRIDPSKLDLTEEVVSLNRVAKVVKGGRRFSFAALVVVGDGHGHVGVGFGKANEVPSSIQKAVEAGKRNLLAVPIIGRTLPHEVIGQYGAGRVLLKPASEGTGLIAGPAVRAVLEKAGIRDCLTKVLGTDNMINVVKATFEGLRVLQTAEQTAILRGKTVEELLGVKGAERWRAGRESAASAKAELAQAKRDERNRLGTYSAGGRDDDSRGRGRGGRRGGNDQNTETTKT